MLHELILLSAIPGVVAHEIVSVVVIEWIHAKTLVIEVLGLLWKANAVCIEIIVKSLLLAKTLRPKRISLHSLDRPLTQVLLDWQILVCLLISYQRMCSQDRLS